MADPLTTCIDLRWRYTILIFVLLYIASWVIFGLVYYIISLIHLDFEWQQNPDVIGKLKHIFNFNYQKKCFETLRIIIIIVRHRSMDGELHFKRGRFVCKRDFIFVRERRLFCPGDMWRV